MIAKDDKLDASTNGHGEPFEEGPGDDTPVEGSGSNGHGEPIEEGDRPVASTAEPNGHGEPGADEEVETGNGHGERDDPAPMESA